MKKPIKTISKMVAILMAVVASFVLIGLIYLMMIGNALGKTFGYSEEELKAYSIFHHGRDIEVLQPAKRTVLGYMKNAKVKTLDRQGIEYTINMNTFGHAKSDNFEEKKEMYKVNPQFKHTREMEELESFGFHNIRIGETNRNKDFQMGLPAGIELTDKMTFDLLYKAVPVLRNLVSKIEAKTDFPMEEVYVDGALLDITTDYTSPKNLGNQFAAHNIDSFYPLYHDKDKEKLVPLVDDINGNRFDVNPWRIGLQCDEMKVYNKCSKYTLRLPVKKYAAGSFIRFDNKNDLTQLLRVIEIVQQVNLPIEQLEVERVAVPDTNGDEKNVGEWKEVIAKVGNVHGIHSVNDIQFDF